MQSLTQERSTGLPFFPGSPSSQEYFALSNSPTSIWMFLKHSRFHTKVDASGGRGSPQYQQSALPVTNAPVRTRHGSNE
jgi:hypothetical protein